MPYNGPGLRHDAVATKAVNHGDPVIEDGFPGVAFKNTQLGAYADPTSATISQIAIGETFTIQVGGIVEVAAAKITGGLGAAPLGTALYIAAATNMLNTTNTNPKFGRVTKVDSTRGVVLVNTNARDTF
jgi:hypothetical protein